MTDLEQPLCHPTSPAASSADPASASAAGAGDPPPIIEIIRDLSNGVRNPEELDQQTRQECVHELTLDGFSNEQIACMMRVSERTVTRDRAAARKAHGLKPDCRLGDELLGEMQSHVWKAVARLSRICNDREIKPAVQVRANEAIGRIYQRFADLVRRFSYAENGLGRLAEQAAQEFEEPPVLGRLAEQAAQEFEEPPLGPARDLDSYTKRLDEALRRASQRARKEEFMNRQR